MSTFEVRGGPITHKYLMHKRTSELQSLVGEYADAAKVARPDVTGLDKRALSHLILSLCRKLPVELARQGE